MTITTLNIRCLRKHSIDVKHDSRLFTSDVMAFTETQLLPQEFNNGFLSDLIPFRVQRQDHSTDKYSSIAVCTRPSVTITNTEYTPSINAFKFNLLLVDSSEERTFLLLYRKQASNSTRYINGLASIVSTYSIDVIFGDFNII